MFARLMGLETITPRALYALIQRRQVTVIDVNSHNSWRMARVPGAVNLDPVTFGDGDLPPTKDSQLVFYCSNPLCRKAPSAARRAKKMGYANVAVMSAGISGWVDAAFPIEGAQAG